MGNTRGRVERSLLEQRRVEMRLGWRGPGGHIRPKPEQGSPPRWVLLGTFRGGPRASAPWPWPPALFRRSARGQHGSGGAHCLARAAPLPSSFPGCGPSRRDVPEPGPPRRSQAGQTLTHSFLEGRRRPASTPSPGDRSGWDPGAADRQPGEKWITWARAPFLSSTDPCPGAGAPQRGRSSPRGLLRAQGGVHSPDLIAGAGAGRPLPRAPGAREWVGRQRPGPGEAMSARGPGRARALTRSQAQRAVSQNSPCLITHSRGR